MCAGAVVHTRLARVVFGAGDPKGGAAGGALNLLQFSHLEHRCEITSGVRLEGMPRAVAKVFLPSNGRQESRRRQGRRRELGWLGLDFPMERGL